MREMYRMMLLLWRYDWGRQKMLVEFQGLQLLGHLPEVGFQV